MTDLQSVATSMIQKLGSTVTYQSPSGTAMDKYGDESFIWGSATTTKAIIDRPQEEQLNWRTEGGITGGRMFFYLPYDESISVGDKITYDSVEYMADEVLKWSFLNKYTCVRVAAHRTSD